MFLTNGQSLTIMKSAHEHPRISPEKKRDHVIMLMTTKGCALDQKFTKSGSPTHMCHNVVPEETTFAGGLLQGSWGEAGAISERG